MRSLTYKSLVLVIVVAHSAIMPLCAQEALQDSTKVEKLEELYVVESAKPSSTKGGAPVQTMDKATFDALGVQNLYEAVRSFSGVALKDYGGVGGIKTVSVRSMGSQHTAVSYDGVAVSDMQTGQIDIGKFSLDNVEYVSLSIGPSDNIFQPAKMFASSSALNIVTSTPKFIDKPINLVAQMKFGSFGTYNPSLIYQQRLSSRWSYSLNGDFLTSRGDYPFTVINGDKAEQYKRVNSEVQSVRGELNIYGRLRDGGKLTIKGNYLYSNRALPGSVVLYKQGGNEWLWDRNGFGSVNYQKRFSDKFSLMVNGKYTYMWSHYLIKDLIYAGGKDEAFYTQNEGYLSVVGEYSPTTNLHFSFAEDVSYNKLDASLIDFVYPSRITSLSLLAGQYKCTRTTVTTSLLATYITEDVKVGIPSDDRFRVSPAVSASYKLFEDYNWRVRASYKDGFRVPTFNDLYYSRVGNKNLKPEKATQFNLGVTWSGELSRSLNYASISVDGYHNIIQDKIVAIPTLFIWRMMNIGKVKMSGVDLSSALHLSLDRLISMVFNLNYSFQYAVNLTDPESKVYGHQIPYTPRHSGSFSLAVKSGIINFSYVCNGVGRRYSFPQNTSSNLIKGYLDHTISLNRKFHLKSGAITLAAEVLNIGNVNYEVVKFYPMPGRSYRLTLKYNY